jgi:hypothetical protein
VIGLALDVVEQHRAAAVHVLLQAGDLEVGIDLLLGLDQVALRFQPGSACAQSARDWIGATARAFLAFLAFSLARAACLCGCAVASVTPFLNQARIALSSIACASGLCIT